MSDRRTYARQAADKAAVETRRDPLRIVSFGGGTGLSTLLRGLRGRAGAFDARGPLRAGQAWLDLAAIVTVTDDGGSSGRLRRDFSMLAPGDIRNCMVALAEDGDLLSRLFQYRFEQGDGLRGHSLGNLLLTALTEVTGDFHEAIRRSSEVLNIRGRIFPSTLSNVRLEAETADGGVIVGESRITGSPERIRRVKLKPRRCQPAEEALEAIRRADVITFGPGSLYTSVIPNLLVAGVAEAVAQSKAVSVYICNLMGQPGESEGYAAVDHVRAILDHVPGRRSKTPLLDYIIVNDKKVPARLRKSYEKEKSAPVEVDVDALNELGIAVISLDLLAPGSMVRHNSDRLAELLIDLARAARRTGPEASR